MLNTIQLNDKGDLVKIAQYMLNYAERKQADGIFNEKFAAEVGDWQAQHKLKVNYIIDSNTWAAIAKTMPTCSTSKNKKSNYICAIQILIGGLEVDGEYGSNTKKGVAAFQSAMNLTADGICGPKTWSALIVGKEKKDVTDNSKILNNCVKYLQWDSKWKKIRYSTHTNSQTIGNSGCGTTSMAMILATWYNSKITPVETSKMSVDNGYRTYDSGTAWGFFKWIFKQYDCFSKYIETSSIVTLEAAIREGALAVCSMNSNDNKFWTSSGHYIVARGVDNTYFYANDPNKETTPRKQEKSKFKKCLKQAFIFWPIEKKSEPEEKESITPSKEKSQTTFDINPNGAIIDISKWQGKIDFKELKKHVGLVIARATCNLNKDIRFDEYATEMIKNRIPFGVYCYSYADTVEKAKNEVKTLVATAKQYNPLFYIMDAEEAKITTAAIKTFAEELRAQTNVKIGCYVAHNRYNTYKYDTLKHLFDITWIPRYGKNNGTIAGATKPAYECDLWQYTSTAKIGGIKGNIDQNITMKEDRKLEWFLNNE